MKYHRDEYEFPYSWAEVTATFWRRYPNPGATHVLSEDLLRREVTPLGELRSWRLLVKTNRAPAWAKRWIRKPWTPIVEESLLQPASQTLTTYTRNLTYAKVLSIEEKCVYSAGIGGGPTRLVREAWISSSVKGFASMIQAFGVRRFRDNVGKTNAGFMTALVRCHGLPSRLPVETSASASPVGVALPAPSRLSSPAAKRLVDRAPLV